LLRTRAGAYASFSKTLAYTPETYPTSIKATDMGFTLMVPRLCGIIAPFATKKLVKDGRQRVYVVINALLYIVAAAAASFLPSEIRGR